MDFFIDIGNTHLIPEKMGDVFYSYEYEDFMINLNKAEEFVRIAEEYGVFEIIPPVDYESLPIIRFSDQ